jgi:hypothetical protein
VHLEHLEDQLVLEDLTDHHDQETQVDQPTSPAQNIQLYTVQNWLERDQAAEKSKNLTR